MSLSTTQQFYSHFIEAGDLCFDVGANIGQRTAAMLGLGAVVVAVEPQANLIEQLRTQFPDSLESGYLYLIPKGLGAEPGEKMLMTTAEHTMCTMSETFVETYRPYNIHYDRRAENIVELTTLDALIETYGVPKLCKVDVEGFDDQVLQGLSYPVHHISFEYNMIPVLAPLAEICIQQMCALGEYEFNFVVMNNLHFELQQWVSAEVMLYILRNELPSRLTHELIQKHIYGDIFARNKKRVKKSIP